MQNRVSSFKISGRLVETENFMKAKNASLTLVLTFVDPYLESVRFQTGPSTSGPWTEVGAFYNHMEGGVYSGDWIPGDEDRKKKEVLVRAIGTDVLGGEQTLAGPYRVHFN